MIQTKVRPILTAAAIALFVAGIGGTLTILDDWYYSLKQPDWAPTGQLFPVIWTIVFATAALAGASTWEKLTSRRDRETLLGLFALNGFLNLFWSFLFFRLQRPDFALYEQVALWLSVLALIVFCGRFSKAAAMLLAPYLVWVTIAGVLNYQVVQLNAPFG